MALKNFFRRVNRGIVLAILLIIGLSCYLTIDSVAFREERDVIQQVLEDYATDMAGFLLLPEEYREIGTEVPDSVIADKIAENDVLINRYFTTSNGNGWNMKRSVSDDLSRMLTQNQKSGNKVKSCDASLSRVKSVTKHGSNLVTVEAVMHLSVTATENAETFYLFYVGGYFKDGAPEASEDMYVRTQNYEISFTCEMVKRDGLWVFSNTEGMSTMYR